jgi:hypothetical protein
MIEAGRCQTSDLTSVANRPSVVTAILPTPTILARGESAIPPVCARHVYVLCVGLVHPRYIKLEDTTTMEKLQIVRRVSSPTSNDTNHGCIQ